MTQYLVLVILLVIILLYFTKSTENFDTYKNHDLGAYNIYSQGNYNFHPTSIEDANRYATYDWSERDKAGLSVYDRYYETMNYGEDNEYVDRELDTNVYDSKFSIRDGQNLMYTYRPSYMVDKNPATAYDWHSDELSVISQKNY